MDLPFQSVCRICLNNNAKFTSLFAIRDHHTQQTYKDTIIECLKVTIDDVEGLPSLICNPCINDFEIAYRFTMRCLASHQKLLENNKNTIKNENSKAPICELKIKAEENDYIESDHVYDEISIDGMKVEGEFLDDEKKLSEIVSDCKIEDYQKKKSYKSRNKIKYNKRTRNLSIKTKLQKITDSVSKLLKCNFAGCDFSTKYKYSLKVHIKKVHQPPEKCDLCGKLVSTSKMLKNHKKRVHRILEKDYMCDICGASFADKSYISIHLRRHQGEAPMQCTICPKSFLLQATLARHMKTHTGEKPYPCEVCGKRFAQKSMITHHMSVHSDEKNFNCHVCGNQFKSKGNLSHHMRLHTTEKSFVCDKCGKGFNTKGSLKCHLQKRHSELSGKCHICGSDFPNISDHMIKHTGETPYQCHICSKRFSGKASLSVHFTRHLNAEKAKCTIGNCTESFPQKCMLDFHILKHHVKEKPFVCQLCNKGYYRGSDLTRHIKVNHNDLFSNSKSYDKLIIKDIPEENLKLKAIVTLK